MPAFDYYFAAVAVDETAHLVAGPWHDFERVEMLSFMLMSSTYDAMERQGIADELVGFGIVRLEHGTVPPHEPDLSADDVESILSSHNS